MKQSLEYFRSRNNLRRCWFNRQSWVASEPYEWNRQTSTHSIYNQAIRRYAIQIQFWTYNSNTKRSRDEVFTARIKIDRIHYLNMVFLAPFNWIEAIFRRILYFHFEICFPYVTNQITSIHVENSSNCSVCRVLTLWIRVCLCVFFWRYYITWSNETVYCFHEWVDNVKKLPMARCPLKIIKIENIKAVYWFSNIMKFRCRI